MKSVIRSSDLKFSFTHMRNLFAVLTCFFYALPPAHVLAVEPDIYDRITVLAESLKVWSQSPPELFTGSADSINPEELFPGAELSTADTSGAVIAHLPDFMGVLSSNVIIHRGAKGKHDKASLVFSLPFEVSDGILYIDEKPVAGSECIAENSLVLDMILNRLLELRTIALPAVCRPHSSPEPDSVSVKLSGERLRQFRFSGQGWYSTLSYIAQYLQAYAGLIKVSRTDIGTGKDFIVSPEYYLLLTLPGISGHHFMIIKETLLFRESSGDVAYADNSEIRFIPYIPTDNLENLFSDNPIKSDSTRWKIHISK